MRMRTYEKTHQWLSFKVHLADAPTTLWMLLGEARSKCEHLAGVALRPATAERLHRVYCAKGVLATTAIEGNTLSEEEVAQRLAGKLQLPKSKEYLGKEIDNVVAAMNLVENAVLDGTAATITPEEIREFNRLILKDLDLDEGVMPGEIRTHSVGVGTYRGAPAEDCEYLLQKLCEWLDSSAFEVKEEIGSVVMGVLKAALAHLYLAWIHPFGDGNGRTARLVEFKILVEAGMPTPAAHLLSNHYNETRTEYYRQLERASKSGGDVLPFIHYAVQGLVDQMREQIQVVRGEQLQIAWRNYVYERFKGRTSAADHRRRELVLALSTQTNPVPRSQLPTLTPILSQEYGNKTLKTLIRDINDLLKEELIRPDGDGYRAAQETILAFLPLSASKRMREVAAIALRNSPNLRDERVSDASVVTPH